MFIIIYIFAFLVQHPNKHGHHHGIHMKKLYYNITHHFPNFVNIAINNVHTPVSSKGGKPRLHINEYTLNGFTNELADLKNNITLDETTAKDCFSDFFIVNLVIVITSGSLVRLICQIKRIF